ncbi:hypothetical protein SLEP1_g11675 [Rubroshorea leprosula]|nr:hypothetical protein SLEP1_g11675 [Rubroshorea leprosula]
MAKGVATQDGGRSRWRQGHNWRIGDSRNRNQGQVESFFIYNFPEEWDAKTLWYQYQNYGKDMDRVYKLRARVASSRRQREIGRQRNAGKKTGTDRVQRSFEHRRSARLKEGIREQCFVQPGLSYVQAVMGNSRKHSALVLNKQAEKKEKSAAMDRISIIQRKSASIEGKSSEEKEGVVNSGFNREEIIDFCPLEEENEWLQGSMVVMVKSMSMISIIQERLDMDGGLINISPLGGRTILLTERLAGYLKEYVLQHKELFELWCEKIHPWDEAPQNYVFDAWQQHPQFRKAVEDKWKELNVEGYAGYKCLNKLKRLKEFLKGWNKEVFGNMEAQFKNVAEKVEKIDLKNEMVDLERSEVKQRKEGFQQIWDMLRVANGRKTLNSIQGIMSDGHWVEEPAMVKKEVMSYFRKMFKEDPWDRPKPSNIDFKKISEEQMVWLERPFSVEEIEEGLKSCDGSKAPGPDGYNLNFLKFFWNSIKDDFVAFFHEFHQSCKLVKGLNSSFLTLIPKKMNPRELKDFRPISLIGCVYKILSKVLANRLKNVMSEIISETQSAFIGGRQLVDSVLVLNEVVDEVRNRKTPAFVFKADFQKAYDCVNWTYLDWMMDRFGFRAKWRGWIKECLSTARVFLWGGGDGGNDEKRKIAWVKWEDICGSKVNGGLGVPDLNLIEKYYGGGQEVNITDVEKLRVSKIWGDILRIGGKSNRLKTMLVKGFKWEVGDGGRVGFWRQIWVGNNSLRDSFPRLFQLATNKEGMVQEYGFWEKGIVGDGK